MPTTVPRYCSQDSPQAPPGVLLLLWISRSPTMWLPDLHLRLMVEPALWAADRSASKALSLASWNASTPRPPTSTRTRLAACSQKPTLQSFSRTFQRGTPGRSCEPITHHGWSGQRVSHLTWVKATLAWGLPQMPTKMESSFRAGGDILILRVRSPCSPRGKETQTMMQIQNWDFSLYATHRESCHCRRPILGLDLLLGSQDVGLSPRSLRPARQHMLGATLQGHLSSPQDRGALSGAWEMKGRPWPQPSLPWRGRIFHNRVV